MTSCCTICTPTAYTVHAVTRSPQIKRPTGGGDLAFLTIAAGSAVRSLTCSLQRSGGKPAIAVPPSSRSCAASLKASRPSIWPTSWVSIAPTSWSDDTRYTHSWPRIFPATAPLSDPLTQADELYQNAGERVCRHSDRATLEGLLVAHTRPDAIVNTDQWSAYGQLAAIGRIHQTVCHTPGRREWARDDDDDGIREVHNNTMEGIWTGCRNFLRLFRGVSKWFLAGYIAVFEGAHNLKWVTPTLLRAMMTPSTTQPT